MPAVTITGVTGVPNIEYKGNNGTLYIFDSTDASNNYKMSVTAVPASGTAYLWSVGGGAAGPTGTSSDIAKGGGGGGFLEGYDLNAFFDPSGNAAPLSDFNIVIGKGGINTGVSDQVKVGGATYIYGPGTGGGTSDYFISYTGGGGFTYPGGSSIYALTYTNTLTAYATTSRFTYPAEPPVGNNINGKVNNMSDLTREGVSILTLIDSSGNPYFPSNATWFGANGGNGGYFDGTSQTPRETTDFSSIAGIHGGSGGIGGVAGSPGGLYGNGGGGGGGTFGGMSTYGGNGSDGVVLIWLATPSAITNIQVALDSSSNVIVSWSGGTGALTTSIVATASGGATVTINSATNPQTITGLTRDKNYEIVISATNEIGISADASILVTTMTNGAMVAGYNGALVSTDASGNPGILFPFNTGSLMFSKSINSGEAYVWAVGGGGNGGGGLDGEVSGGGGSGGNYVGGRDIYSLNPVVGKKYNITVGAATEATTIRDSSGTYLLNIIGGTSGSNGSGVTSGANTIYSRGLGGVANSDGLNSTKGYNGGDGSIAGTPPSGGANGITFSFNIGGTTMFFNLSGGGGGGGGNYPGADGGSNPGSGGGGFDSSSNQISPSGANLSTLGGDSYAGGGIYGGGGAAGFGGGGGGGDVDNAGGAGSAGAVFIFLSTPPLVPSKPDNYSLGNTTTTYKSITARGNPSGITGSPFTSATFYLYPANGSVILAQGNGALDASGNYYYTFTSVDASGTPLTSDTAYDIRWLLTNAAGKGQKSENLGFDTAAAPVPSTPPDGNLTATKTYNSITVVASSSGISNIDANYARVFAVIVLYYYGSAIDESSELSIDSSGNWSYKFVSLQASTDYDITFYVGNKYGDGNQSPGLAIRTSDIPPPGKPPYGSLTLSSTDNSISIIGNINNVSNIIGYGTVTASFYLYDNTLFPLNTDIDVVGDASGNYYSSFTSGGGSPLDPSTTYKVGWYLTHLGGPGLESLPHSITTLTPRPQPPSSVTLTLTSKTSTTITLTGNSTTVSGIPFTGATFRRYDASGNSVGSVAGASDGSGNYVATFSSLSASTTYYFRWALINATATGNFSSPSLAVTTNAPPSGVPGTPSSGSLTSTSRTSSSITLTGVPTGISGSPFTAATFGRYDASGNSVGSVAGVADASGNYVATFNSLTSSTVYYFRWSLTNGSGAGPASSPALAVTTLAAAVPSTPANGSLTGDTTYNSIGANGDPTGITNSPTSANFKLYDSSGTLLLTSPNQTPDATSGMYKYNFTSLSSSTLYKLSWYLSNGVGAGSASSIIEVTTAAPPPGTPSSGSLTSTSRTSSSITLTGVPTGVSGSPFTAANFGIYDASGNAISKANTVNSPDGSGNYVITFDSLTSSTVYYFRWSLGNTNGTGQWSSPDLAVTTLAAAVPGTPSSGSLTSTARTSSSITLTGVPTGISGSPFTAATFGRYDASGNSVGSVAGVTDASGNYVATFNSLTSSTVYYFRWSLTNGSGAGPASSPALAVTTLAGAVPGTPSSGSLTSTSRTSSSITLTGVPTGVSGSPFTAATFGRYDASGNSVGSVAGVTDASGNYVATFNSLTSSTVYYFRWSLTNGSGAGPASSPDLAVTTLSAAVPSTPGSPPTVVSYTYNSVTVSANATGITGSPTSATFALYSNTDVFIKNQTVSSVDASGNYVTTLTSLTPATAGVTYKIAWFLSNGGGSGSASTKTSFTTAALPSPSAPANGSLTFTITSNSVTLTGNPSSVPQSPFTSVTILRFDASGNQIDSQVATINGSGNYVATFSSLNPSTTYYFAWKLQNQTGSGVQSSIITVATSAVNSNPPCFLRGSRILCLNEGLREEYIPIEEIKVGTPVKTLNGAYIKVHSIGSAIFKNPDNADIGPNRLFKLTPAKYPELTEDLILTGCHSTLVDTITLNEEAECMRLMKTLYMTSGKVRLMAFIDEKSEPYIAPGEHEIWHLALENENPTCNYGIYASGLLVETASIKNMRERSGLVLVE